MPRAGPKLKYSVKAQGGSNATSQFVAWAINTENAATKRRPVNAAIGGGLCPIAMVLTAGDRAKASPTRGLKTSVDIPYPSSCSCAFGERACAPYWQGSLPRPLAGNSRLASTKLRKIALSRASRATFPSPRSPAFRRHSNRIFGALRPLYSFREGAGSGPLRHDCVVNGPRFR